MGGVAGGWGGADGVGWVGLGVKGVVSTSCSVEMVLIMAGRQEQQQTFCFPDESKT